MAGTGLSLSPALIYGDVRPGSQTVPMGGCTQDWKPGQPRMHKDLETGQAWTCKDLETGQARTCKEE
jgi:hypothetical protein